MKHSLQGSVSFIDFVYTEGMSEAFPSPHKAELDKASMEGNVKVPQVNFGVLVLSANRILAQEQPKEALESLLAPIPIDKELRERTKKANAQHAHHGIGRELSPEDVRRVQTGLNLATLRFIGNISGALTETHSIQSYNEKGEWVTGSMKRDLENVKQSLTPKRTEFISNVLGAIDQILHEPDVIALLNQRKNRYGSWGTMDGAEKSKARSSSVDDLRGVIDLIQTRLYEKFPRQNLAPEEKEVLRSIRFLLDREIPPI